MDSDFLKTLFKSLNNKDIDYLILRGYQNLPESYSYDLDFSVRNKKELIRFFNVVNSLAKTHGYSTSIDTVRSGLIKVFLHFEEQILRVDVFYCYKYAGLFYMDIDDLHKSKRTLKTGINVPAINYELAISLLKELLHNSRIRKDKVKLLRSQYVNETFDIPFLKFFSKKTIAEISTSLFSGEKLYFNNFSRNCRFDILKSNLKFFGISNTLISILEFFYVKYLNQKKYNNIIKFIS